MKLLMGLAVEVQKRMTTQELTMLFSMTTVLRCMTLLPRDLPGNYRRLGQLGLVVGLLEEWYISLTKKGCYVDGWTGSQARKG